VSAGIWFARVVAAGLLAIGAGAVVAPKPSSRGYGMPSDDPVALAFVRAMGTRDIALGLIVAALCRPDARTGLTAAIGATALVAGTDFALVAGSEAPEAERALFVHGGGVAALALLWVLLRGGR
jgi:hypothetical protein